MLIDYVLSRNKFRKQSNLHEKYNNYKKVRYIKRNINEDYLDPTEILRNHGIKIKKIIPKETFIEIYLFDDIRTLNLKMLNVFYYKKDFENNKILVSYNTK